MRIISRIALLRPDLSPERINQILSEPPAPVEMRQFSKVDNDFVLNKLISYDKNIGTFTLSPDVLQKAYVTLPEFAGVINQIKDNSHQRGFAPEDVLDGMREPFESDSAYVDRLRGAVQSEAFSPSEINPNEPIEFQNE